MPDVFISYSQRDPDRATARAIVEGLEAAGLDVFWDQKIPPGAKYSEYTEKQAKLAPCMVLLWSKNAARSTWVRSEAEIGRTRNCLIPLSLDGAKMPLELRPIQFQDFSSWDLVHTGPQWALFIGAVQQRVAPSFRKAGVPRYGGGGGGSLAGAIAPHLPYLRRYSRALHGTQQLGDMLVATTLESLIAEPTQMNDQVPRVGLYRAYHRISPIQDMSQAALLLTTVEAFKTSECAEILELTAIECSSLLELARKRLGETPGRILIIEDEPLIAIDLTDIVTSDGHAVVAVAQTMVQAVDAAELHKPDLILADIQLADGSSGIDAVSQISQFSEAPVVFVTAFPERLLTGERPEPAFLITKPYQPDTIRAAVFQALYFQQRQAA